jgi:hypothetical protein
MTKKLNKKVKKLDKKTDPYPMQKPMATLTRQSMAYITVKGIESETSYLQRDWILFALKELADNGFDFLNDYYPSPANPKESRKIAIRVWIEPIVKSDRIMFRMVVRNSNVDNVQPIFENLDNILDFNQWCSTKRYQYRETCGSLGDGLKRILGMGYASWTSNDNLDLAYEYNQWKEPLILRFDGKEYRAFIQVDDVEIRVNIEDPTEFDAPDFTEVQVALPVQTKGLWGEDPSDYYFRKLQRYYNLYKMAKTQTQFSFVKEEMN